MSKPCELDFKVDDLAVGEMQLVEACGREIVLCSTPTGVYAVDAVCTHALAFLDEGSLDGHEIECPLHGARFDVVTGTVRKKPATEPLNTYRVTAAESLICVWFG